MEERKVRKFDPKIQVPIQFTQIVPSVGFMNVILREYTEKVCMQSREQNSFLQRNQKLASLSQKSEECIYFNHTVGQPISHMC